MKKVKLSLKACIVLIGLFSILSILCANMLPVEAENINSALYDSKYQIIDKEEEDSLSDILYDSPDSCFDYDENIIPYALSGMDSLNKCSEHSNSHGEGRANGGLNLLSDGCRNYAEYEDGKNLYMFDYPFYIDTSSMETMDPQDKLTLIGDINTQAKLWNQVIIHDGAGGCDKKGHLVEFYNVKTAKEAKLVFMRKDGNYSGQFHPEGNKGYIYINYEEKGSGERPGRHLDTIAHELGHALGLDDLDTSNNKSHTVLMGYANKATVIDHIIQYPDIQGAAVMTGGHTCKDEFFKRYVYKDNRYLHICFYCDRVNSLTYVIEGSQAVQDSNNCVHDYLQMVSAGDRHWLKCTKCYKVVETKWNDDESPNDGTFEYKPTYNGWYSIDGVRNFDDVTSISIPSTFNGRPVVAIGDNVFSNCVKLKNVVIPSSIESIGENAFYGCKNLRTVELQRPADIGITVLRTNAFDGTMLDYILVPDNESEVAYKNANPGIAELFCYMFKYTSQSDGTYSIGKGTYNLSGELTIPSTYKGKDVTKIEDSAFSGCTGLISIDIPSGVKSIGIGAFNNCIGLIGISIPSSLTSIGDRAFQNCSKLLSVYIPPSITSIGSYAFSGCIGLKGINIPNGVRRIGGFAFNGCGLTSVNIPASVTSIAGSAFANCPLTSITVDPNNEMLKSDGNCIINRKTNALVLGCNTSVIPNYTWAIIPEAFYGCNKLSQINIPSSVIFIGDYAFAGCTNISKISIPSSVRGVGAYAFDGWKSTQTIYCSIDIQLATSVWDKNWLGGCNAKVNYNAANDYSKFNFTLQGDGYVISGKPEYANETVFLTIPSYYNGYPVKQIRPEGFRDFVNLREVKFLPDSQLEVIWFEAFYGCSSLNRINIPSTVKRIEGGAFLECYELRSLILPSSILEINSMAFGAPSPTYSITIYTDAEFAPQGWGFVGNRNCYVYGDCTFVGDYEYVESIVLQYDNSGLINEPYRDGFMVYWGRPANIPEWKTADIIQGVVPAGTRLFAYWIDMPVFMSLLGIDDIELLPEGWWENLDWFTPELFEQFTWDVAA